MKWVAGFLALTSVVGISQANEIPSPFNNNGTGILLGDDILDAQRGKFIAANKSHYFGIEFVTTISGPMGSMITSGMQLNVNFNRSGPSVGVNLYGNQEPDPSDGGISDSVPNGSGLVQLAQIAGDANTGVNDFSFQPGYMPQKGSPISQGQYQINLPDGMMQFEFTPSTIGMAVTSGNGQTVARQMLRNATGNQGFVQQFRIEDNHQLLSNQAKIYMGDGLGPYASIANTLRQQLPIGFK
ncbi:hypothetical protein [Oceanimonas sp. CAM02]|uniref:hypothetical protein n=1 Tax=Oceanimonas sp. CAM02 TaxID=3080336 RepID=UPI002935971C|nr:hypothetical protein [Oceanimonas sp. CAM02]MDV2857270.1 hypothetical protein [Oceanimonas sp. CAM02]